MERAPGLQKLLDAMAKEHNISASFTEASDHAYWCRCDKCLAWWAGMGPDGEEDEPGAYGPFAKEEVDAFRKESEG